VTPVRKRKSSEKSSYRHIFDKVPIAIIEIDLDVIQALSQDLKKQTVSHVRKFLSDHQSMVKKAFKDIKILNANQAAFDLWECKNKTDLSERLYNHFQGVSLDVLVEMFISFLQKENVFTSEFKLKTSKRNYLDVFLKAAVEKDNFRHVLFAFQDITIWKRVERQLRKKSQLDGLTKLYNHNTISERLEEELIRAKRYGLSLSCLMIDLDRFKVINDQFGHQRGDQVLKKVATMIRNCVRKVDLVGRYGGDEFLVVLPETKAGFAKYAAARIQKIFNEKNFRYKNNISFRITLSIGITGFPSKKIKNGKDMISVSDRAMYAAKKSGRNCIFTL